MIVLDDIYDLFGEDRPALSLRMSDVAQGLQGIATALADGDVEMASSLQERMHHSVLAAVAEGHRHSADLARAAHASRLLFRAYSEARAALPISLFPFNEVQTEPVSAPVLSTARADTNEETKFGPELSAVDVAEGIAQQAQVLHQLTLRAGAFSSPLDLGRTIGSIDQALGDFSTALKESAERLEAMQDEGQVWIGDLDSPSWRHRHHALSGLLGASHQLS